MLLIPWIAFLSPGWPKKEFLGFSREAIPIEEILPNYRKNCVLDHIMIFESVNLLKAQWYFS